LVYLSVSADPLSPPTVENLKKTGVLLPTVLKKLALVYLVTSLVTSKYPWAPDPLAWTTLSGILSLSKAAILSIKLKSCKNLNLNFWDLKYLLIKGWVHFLRQ